MQVKDGSLVLPLPMPASVKSEKFRFPSRDFSLDALPSPTTRRHESITVNHIDPEVLRRATLKIDFYLIPIIGMFCELSLLIRALCILITLILRSSVFSGEYSCNLLPLTFKQSHTSG